MTKKIFIGLLATLLLSTIGFIVYTVGVAGQQKQSLDEQLASLNQRFDELAMVSDSYDAFKEKFNERVRDFDTLKVRIPGNQSYARTLEAIRNAAEENMLEVVALSPQLNDVYPALHTNQELVHKHVECFPVEIQSYGRFMELARFLDDLAAMDMLINIANLNIETEMEHGGVLACQLTLFTYIFNEYG